jgi:hypothetical protein
VATARNRLAIRPAGENARVPLFVGRTDTLARLDAAYTALLSDGGRRLPALVLVAGEAGMGKTAVLASFAGQVTARGGRAVWGTCWDAEQAPAYWPWTQALRALLDDPAPGDADLGVIVPGHAAPAEGSARFRVFDAAGRLLGRAAERVPVVVILDDLQWADRSTLDLMRFLSGVPMPGPLLIAGAYRPDELDPATGGALAALAAADRVALAGLSPAEVADLVAATPGAPAGARWADLVHRRSGGHPFFARELAQALAAGDSAAVPDAARDAIARRLARIGEACRRMLEAAAVAGPRVLPDVLASVTGGETASLVAEATAAGLLTGTGFGHDLYREALYASLAPAARADLHHRVAEALLLRRDRGGTVYAAELARHFAAAVSVAGPAPALAWARQAAADEAARYAFAEAADHLRRARTAVADAGLSPGDADLVDLYAAEADLRSRAGDTDAARDLLAAAWQRALDLAEPEPMGAVALGYDRLGARFAMPRTDLIGTLDQARQALAGTGTAAEAQVTAALARQLQHSVARDRPRARPLADRAVAIAREVADPATLADCLLAQHDTRWTPGTASQRAAIAGEITDLADRSGDRERYAQGLLLAATAHLEAGSPAFRATLAQYADATAGLRQPRHDYLLRTRQAALALLDGDIDAGDRLSADAAALGERVGDRDAGNVRMSQKLEVVRARADPDALRETAAEAVRWWVGAPAHAHAIAAGFLARAGDLDAARRHVDTVLALDDWRTDRSYLWSIFIGELVVAAIALRDAALCRHLLDDLLPLADTCAVNGALVCFQGAHAHRVGLLHAALGEPSPARERLEQALDIHRRLGARVWEAETRAALDAPEVPATGSASLRRVGDLWLASYKGQTAYLRDTKGLHDLAALLARPGDDVPALLLAGAADVTGPGEPALDRVALSAYRRRLADLDGELAAARDRADLGRQERASAEREQLLAELGRSTRRDGTSRSLAATTAERARKAVSARIRDAIRRIAQSLPDLATHLDRTIHTRTACRYDP